jgi:hypothetical protein
MLTHHTLHFPIFDFVSVSNMFDDRRTIPHPLTEASGTHRAGRD